jgi:hypothetical protein
MNSGSRQSTGRTGGSPNPRAGRPQSGSDSPQLSQQTQKKLEHISGGSNSGSDRGSSNQPMATQEDIEDLKAQNQKMIELLERIARSL